MEETLPIVRQIFLPNNNEVAVLDQCNNLDDVVSSCRFVTCVQSHSTLGVVLLSFNSTCEIFYKSYKLKVPQQLWPSWLVNRCQGALDPITMDLSFVSSCSLENKPLFFSQSMPTLLNEEDLYCTLSAHNNTIVSQSELLPQEPVDYTNCEDNSITIFKHPMTTSTRHPFYNFELDAEWTRLKSPPEYIRGIIQETLDKEGIVEDVLLTYLFEFPENEEYERETLFVTFMHYLCTLEEKNPQTNKSVEETQKEKDLQSILCWSKHFDDRFPLQASAALYFATNEIAIFNRGIFFDDVCSILASQLKQPLSAEEKERLNCVWWCVYFKKSPYDSENFLLYKQFFIHQKQLESTLHNICTLAAETSLPTSPSSQKGFFCYLLAVYNIQNDSLETFLKDICDSFQSDDDNPKTINDKIQKYLGKTTQNDDLAELFETLNISDCINDCNRPSDIKTPFTRALLYLYVS